MAPLEGAERCRELRGPRPRSWRHPQGGQAGGARDEVSGSSLDGPAGDGACTPSCPCPLSPHPRPRHPASRGRRATTAGNQQVGRRAAPGGGGGGAFSGCERRRAGLILPSPGWPAKSPGPHAPLAQPHLSRPPLGGISKVNGCKTSLRPGAGPGPPSSEHAGRSESLRAGAPPLGRLRAREKAVPEIRRRRRRGAHWPRPQAAPSQATPLARLSRPASPSAQRSQATGRFPHTVPPLASQPPSCTPPHFHPRGQALRLAPAHCTPPTRAIGPWVPTILPAILTPARILPQGTPSPPATPLAPLHCPT